MEILNNFLLSKKQKSATIDELPAGDGYFSQRHRLEKQKCNNYEMQQASTSWKLKRFNTTVPSLTKRQQPGTLRSSSLRDRCHNTTRKLGTIIPKRVAEKIHSHIGQFWRCWFASSTPDAMHLRGSLATSSYKLPPCSTRWISCSTVLFHINQMPPRLNLCGVYAAMPSQTPRPTLKKCLKCCTGWNIVPFPKLVS